MSDEPTAIIDDEMLLSLATDADPRMQLMGRWLATGVHDTVQRFINSELARGSQEAAVMLAIQGYFAQVVASFLYFNGGGRDATDVVDACTSGYREVMERHFTALSRMGTPQELHQLGLRQMRKAGRHV